MCKGAYQKIIVFALLSTTYVIYVLNQLAQHSRERQQLYFVHGRLYYTDSNEPQLNLPLGDIYRPNKSSPSEVVHLQDKQQPSESPGEPQIHFKQQPNVPSEEVSLHDTQQSSMPTEEKSTLAHIAKIDQQLLDLAKNVDFNTSVTVGKVYKYIAKVFSPSQVTNLVARMVDVANLSAKAQKEFLYCAGLVVLRNLNGSQPKTPIPAPPSLQHCKKMSFKNSGPVIALSSVPGSGNSWVRQLLESATGIYTGAVYCDPAYVKAGMIGELIDTNNVLAVKTHYVPTYVSKIMHNDKAIYLVRSPFGTILAENNRNIARMSKKYKQKDFHTEEVDFNYGKCSMTKRMCVYLLLCIIKSVPTLLMCAEIFVGQTWW